MVGVFILLGIIAIALLRIGDWQKRLYEAARADAVADAEKSSALDRWMRETIQNVHATQQEYLRLSKLSYESNERHRAECAAHHQQLGESKPPTVQ